MTTQLIIYNKALRALTERNCIATTDNTDPVIKLNEIWDEGCRTFCLEQGLWKFALKEATLTPSLTEIPTSGYANAFAKPADFIRLAKLCTDEYFRSPKIHVQEKGTYYYADDSTLYLQYVSNDVLLGYNLAIWPESFTNYVAAYMAWQASPRIQPDKKEELKKDCEEARLIALGKDAVASPTQFLPSGSWAGANLAGRKQDRPGTTTLY